MDEYFERIKKLKETLNFISNSKNFFELKKILDSNKNNIQNIDKNKMLQMKMIENLNKHLLNRANLINKLKLEKLLYILNFTIILFSISDFHHLG